MEGIQKITAKKPKTYVSDIRDREILKTIFSKVKSDNFFGKNRSSLILNYYLI